MTEKLTYQDACEKLKTATEWLDFYLNHFGQFWTQFQKGGLFSKWFLYNSYEYNKFYEHKKYVPNNRLIFPIELVFDIDLEDIKDNHRLRDLISDKLQRERFNHSVWRNGSECGNHIHMFFPELVRYSTDDRLVLKQLLLEYIVGKTNLRKFKVDTTVTYPKKLINLERSENRNTINRIKYLVRYYDFDKLNQIPKRVLDTFNKYIQSKPKGFTFVDLSSADKPCISFFEREEFTHFKDYRKRAVFILASEYKRRGMSTDEIITRLKKWRDYILNGYKEITDSYIKCVASRSTARITCRYRSRILDDMGMRRIAESCPTCSQYLIGGKD